MGGHPVVAMFVSNISPITGNVYIENGTRSARKVSNCELNPEQRRAVVGLHAISGNNYISSFFRKGKKTNWKTASKGFMNFFSCLGEIYHLTEKQENKVERSVCSLYGKPKLKHVNEVPAAIFLGRHNESGNIVDLSLLPPCRENLLFTFKMCKLYRLQHATFKRVETNRREVHRSWMDRR